MRHPKVVKKNNLRKILGHHDDFFVTTFVKNDFWGVFGDFSPKVVKTFGTQCNGKEFNKENRIPRGIQYDPNPYSKGNSKSTTVD